MKKGVYKSLQEKFESKVIFRDDELCWKTNHQRPYGRISYFKDGKKTYISIHQAAYLLYNGEIKDGLWVLHRCNNNYCCNPKHLYLGDQKQNELDKVNSGSISGENHPNSTLKEKDVLNIRKLISENKSDIEIASLYSVKKAAINKIRHFRTWKKIIN